MTTSRRLRPAAVICSAAVVAVAAVIFSLSYCSDAPLDNLPNCYVLIDRLKNAEFSFVYANVGALLASVGFGRESRRWESRNVTIRSSFRGIDVSSLTKNVAEEVLSDPNSNLRALLSWNEPQQHVKSLPLSRFSVFLPPRGNVHGDPWWLVEAKGLRNSDGHVEANVYEPPACSTPAETLLGELFGMFHRNVFLVTRASPAGTAAVVARSTNGTRDILFRSHIEFQISAPPERPLWFTPAQFQGRVVISDDGSALHYFEAHVPTDRQLNVDLEWLAQQHNSDVQRTEVDIGKVAEMALRLDSPSGQSAKIHSSSISYNEEDEVLRKLHQMFFPFLKVPYHNLSAAAAEAKQHKKLVHSIITWGPLDDQSC
uniref:Putative selenoprotein n n=1 Tax=Rhipicephalus pulchellus TaxID=72859 RepID=L7LWB3_RHIPC